jgi:hypothetical protein
VSPSKRVLGLLAALVVGAGSYLSYSEYREREARAFCDSFQPLLAQYHAANGRYPDTLPRDWYPQNDLPDLVRPDFYVSFSNGQGFLMRFVNPMRPPSDNVVAYQSDIGHWATWDGY